MAAVPKKADGPKPAATKKPQPNRKVPGKRATVPHPSGRGRVVSRTDEGDLCPRQEVFVHEYLKDFNASRAGRVAGYASAAVANSILREPKVHAAVEAAKAARLERTKLSADEVLLKLAAMARVDVRELYNEDGTLKNPRDLTADEASVLHTFEVAETWAPGHGADKGRLLRVQTKKVKGVDPATVVQLAMRHMGLLNDKLQLNHGPVLVYDMARLAALTTEELKQLDAITAKLEAVVVPGQGTQG